MPAVEVKPVGEDAEGKPPKASPEVAEEYNAMLQGRTYVSPRDQRQYQVDYIYYDAEHDTLVGYVSPTDQLQTEELARSAVTVFGRGGLLALIDEFEKTGAPVDGGVQGVAWPKTEAEMLKLQMEDETIRHMFQEVNNDAFDNGVDMDKAYFYQPLVSTGLRGALRRRVKWKKKSKREFSQVVIPKCLEPLLFRYYHEGLAHPGANRMVETIKLSYWRPKIRESAVAYVDLCRHCKLRKVYRNAPAIPIQKWFKALRPWERVHIDLCGRFLCDGGYCNTRPQ